MDPAKYHLRLAHLSDAEKLYQWVSSPDVRKNAINQDVFSYESHLNWVSNRMQSAMCKFYILEYDQTPVGQLRIEKINEEWLLDYSIDRDWRGKGLGKRMIELLLTQVESLNLVAQVLETNTASIRVFEKLGFRPLKHENIKGRNFILFKKHFETPPHK